MKAIIDENYIQTNSHTNKLTETARLIINGFIYLIHINE